MTGNMLATAWKCFRTRYSALLIASALLLGAVVVSQAMSFALRPIQDRAAQRGLEQQRQMRAIFQSAMQGQRATPAAAAAAQGDPKQQEASLLDSAVMIGGGAVSLLLLVFIGLQLTASALCTGAAVVGGRWPAEGKWRGFARYWQVTAVGCLLLVALFVASIPASCITGVVGLVRYINGEDLLPRDPVLVATSMVAFAVMSPLAVWVLSRWLWGFIRTADGQRPAAGPIEGMRMSWHATAGPNRGPAFGALYVAFFFAVVASAPGWGTVLAGLFMQSAEVEAAGWVLLAILQLLVVFPWLLAALGALYERIMSGDLTVGEIGGGAP